MQATCEEEGIQTRFCQIEDCNGIDTRLIAKLIDCDNTSIRHTQNDNRYGVKFAINPVSDNAEINVILPNNERPVETKIAIYDMTGNVVFECRDAMHCVSTNGAIVWDLRNTAGRFVANGTYLLIAEVKSASGKIYAYSARLGVKR